LLEHSVKALKGESAATPPQVTLRLDFLEVGTSDVPAPRAAGTPLPSRRIARAALPPAYVPEAQHRVELYRRLAQVADRADVEGLQREVRDRFGRPPPPVELLFQVTSLKLLAGELGVTVVECREDKLMLQRDGDYVMVGGRFPRLTRREAPARLNEIRKVLLALGASAAAPNRTPPR
jgi:transcription-repair coupling factor (superfamily II helicase)